MMSMVETKHAKHAQQRVWKTRKQDADSDERTRIWKSTQIRFWKSSYSGRDKKGAKDTIKYSGRGRDNGIENKTKDPERSERKIKWNNYTTGTQCCGGGEGRGIGTTPMTPREMVSFLLN